MKKKKKTCAFSAPKVDATSGETANIRLYFKTSTSNEVILKNNNDNKIRIFFLPKRI